MLRMSVFVDVKVDDSAQVHVALQASAPAEADSLHTVEEPMAFKVGVVADESGGLPRLSLELDGQVIATFPQTEEGRQDFWRHMDTIRVAEATAEGLEEKMKETKIE